MVYVYSDPHYYHKNIIKYTDRPFKDVEEMNSELIKRWNNTVSKEDKVFILGDFGFGNQEQMKEIVSRLNGYIVLIMGNHDRHKTAKWWRECGFFQVSEYPIIYRDFYILSHEPVFMNSHMPYLNIHGHKHHISMDKDYYVNVSVEKTDYKPVSFDELVSGYNMEEE